MTDVSFSAALLDNDAFLTDMARFVEKALTEKQIKKKYRFDDEVWTDLGADDRLAEAIEARVAERIRNGACKRERAQALVANAPAVLGDIMMDNKASPKHRIDASKTLDSFAAKGPQGASTGEKFEIKIIIGDEPGDVLHFSKTIKPTPPSDIECDDTHTTTLAMIEANKQGDDGSGQPL
jgi:hypothetical protein